MKTIPVLHSTRAAAQHLGLPHHVTVRRILHNHRMHLFHLQRVQLLLPRDFGPRALFSEWFLQKQVVERNVSRGLFGHPTCIRFFLVGAMKALVYETPVDTEEDLGGRIVAAAGGIAEIPNVLESVRHSLYKRNEKCGEVHGDHFEQFL